MTRKTAIKLYLLVLFLAASVLLGIIKKNGLLDDVDAVEKIRHTINGFGIYSPFVFILTIGVASNLFVPMSLLVTSGGILFGAVNGFVYSFSGATLSVFLGYIFYSYARVRNHSQADARIIKSIERIQNRGVLAVIVIRLLAIPFAAQNLASLMVNVPFRSYLVGSVIGMTPWLIGFSFFGDSIIGLKYHIAAFSVLLLIGLYVLAFKLNS